jgi:hypothetical protein
VSPSLILPQGRRQFLFPSSRRDKGRWLSTVSVSPSLILPQGRKKIFISFNASPFEGGLWSDDCDEYQTPSEGMTKSSYYFYHWHFWNLLFVFPSDCFSSKWSELGLGHPEEAAGSLKGSSLRSVMRRKKPVAVDFLFLFYRKKKGDLWFNLLLCC